MLHVDRQKEILALLFDKGSVSVGELSKKYGVRDETIRRDLKALAKDWNIEIIYGGAHVKEAGATQGVKELALAAKRGENHDAKQIIARKAASLIEDGDVIGLNAGSTVEYILDYIGEKSVSIVTLTLTVAAKAMQLPHAEVYMPGGKARKHSGVAMGPHSLDFIRSFHIDKCFFGVSAFSKQRGFMHPVLEEVELNRAMLSVSQKTYVVTDSSKINKTAFFSLAAINEVDAFIVDDDFPEDYREYLSQQKIEII